MELPDLNPHTLDRLDPHHRSRTSLPAPKCNQTPNGRQYNRQYDTDLRSEAWSNSIVFRNPKLRATSQQPDRSRAAERETESSQGASFSEEATHRHSAGAQPHSAHTRVSPGKDLVSICPNPEWKRVQRVTWTGLWRAKQIGRASCRERV